MDLLFYTESNSNDEYNNIDLDSNLIRSHNYINPNEECIFDPFSELPNNQINAEDNLYEEESFPNNNSDRDNPDASNRHSVLFVTTGKAKRGRQVIENDRPQHLPTDSDNLQKKIQVHFFTFIINLSNDAIKAVLGSKTPYNFKQIAHKIKILISYDNVNILNKSAIKDIIKMEISPKYKKNTYFINNETILNAVCLLSKVLKDFFDINYLEFFNDYYFNEKKETNKVIFEGNEIPFSKGTKNFYHLLKKFENYKTLLIDSVKRVYFNGYNSLIKNKSFVIFKKDIELNEWKNYIYYKYFILIILSNEEKKYIIIL